MKSFFIEYPPSKFLDIFVRVLAIIGLLVAAGFLDISTKIEVKVLEPPVWLIDLEQFKQLYAARSIPGLPPPNDEFLKAIKSDRECKWLLVNYPERESDEDWEKFRAVAYHNRVITSIPIGAATPDYKWQLGHLDGDTLHRNKIVMRNLVNDRDKRIAASSIIGLDVSEKQIKNDCVIGKDSLIGLIKKFPDGDKYSPFVESGVVYNIISIENNSNSKAENLVFKALFEIEPIPMRSKLSIVGWTFSLEGGVVIKDSAQYVEFSLPFLRGKNSVQLVIQTRGVKLENQHLAIEYQRIRSIDKNKVLNYVIICIIVSLVGYFCEGIIVVRIKKATKETLK